MKRKIAAAAVVAALGAAFSVPAAAQQKPEDQIKMRKAAFTLMSWNFGPLGAVVKGKKAYDKDEVVKLAERVQFASMLPWEGFGPGTDKGETRAKPEVWSDNAKFKKIADQLQAETTKLLAAAKSGDEGQLKAAFGATAKQCRACHDDFRSK